MQALITQADQTDYSFHPQLMPGNATYDRLLVSNPRKLKTMIHEESLAVTNMNTPEAMQEARERNKQSEERLRIDYANHGKHWHRLQDALQKKERMGKNVFNDADLSLLGLDATATLTKRDVTNAYRRKARKLHPDVGGDADQFKALYAAYRAVLAATPK